MIKMLFAVASLSAGVSTDLKLEENIRPITVTFDPFLVEKHPSFILELENITFNESYVDQPIVFSQQNLCDPSNLYITTLENATNNPNVGIITSLNETDISSGGVVQISVENIEFSNSINEPRDEFTPASVLLTSFFKPNSQGIDPGYLTTCEDNLTQCVTLVR